MKPLIILISVFIISLLVNKIFKGNVEFALSGRIAMSAMLLFTAIGHFAFTKGMSMMLPDFIPFKTETVYLTGVIEIAAAIGLFIPNFRGVTAWLLIVFLDRKSTRLNSSHVAISYAVFCLKKKKNTS